MREWASGQFAVTCRLELHFTYSSGFSNRCLQNTIKSRTSGPDLLHSPWRILCSGSSWQELASLWFNKVRWLSHCMFCSVLHVTKSSSLFICVKASLRVSDALWRVSCLVRAHSDLWRKTSATMCGSTSSCRYVLLICVHELILHEGLRCDFVRIWKFCEKRSWDGQIR